MRIKVDKLKVETLVDILESAYGTVEVKKEDIHVFGGSPREEFTLMVNGKVIGPTCNTFLVALRYNVKLLLRSYSEDDKNASQTRG